MDVDSPNKKTDIVTIDISTRNGKTFDHDFLGKDVKDLWKKALNRDPDEVIGYSTYRHANKTLRLNIELKTEIAIKDISDTPDFVYETASAFQNSSYACKIVGAATKEANIGDVVKVTVRRTHYKVKPEQIAEWLSKYGKIMGPLRSVFVCLC